MSAAPAEDYVWFMGPTKGPGYSLLRSGEDCRPEGAEGDGGYHRPPNFPWKSMDRRWSACYGAQGAPAMDYAGGWSVLSVADYTQDSRPNVMVAFAVDRPDVPEAEMMALAAARYPTIWARLGVAHSQD